MAEHLAQLFALVVVANVIVFAPLAVVAAEVLERPNRPAILLGVLMGPVGLILIGFLEPRHVARCPACFAPVRYHGATRCRACGDSLADDPLASLDR